MAKQIARNKPAGKRVKARVRSAALVQRSARKVAKASAKTMAPKRSKSAAAPTLGAASAIAQKLVRVGPKDPAGRIFRRYWIPIEVAGDLGATPKSVAGASSRHRRSGQSLRDWPRRARRKAPEWVVPTRASDEASYNSQPIARSIEKRPPPRSAMMKASTPQSRNCSIRV